MKTRLLTFLCLPFLMSDSNAADSVFHPDQVENIAVSPGVSLKELIGNLAKARTDRYSVAQFTLAPGATTGLSHTKVAEESFLILSGSGHVTLKGKRHPVRPGSVVVIPPKTSHSLDADAGTPIVFYAVCAPAFSPDDYVLETGKK